MRDALANSPGDGVATIRIDELPVAARRKRARAIAAARRSVRAATAEHTRAAAALEDAERAARVAVEALDHSRERRQELERSSAEAADRLDKRRGESVDAERRLQTCAEEAGLAHARSSAMSDVSSSLVAWFERASASPVDETALEELEFIVSRIEELDLTTASDLLEHSGERNHDLRAWASSVRAADALRTQLEEILRTGDLDEEVRAAIDAAHGRVVDHSRRSGHATTDSPAEVEAALLGRYGFASYLDYSIAISTGALPAHAERTLADLVQPPLPQSTRDHVDAMESAASTRVAAAADADEAKRVAAAALDTAVDAVIAAENEMEAVTAALRDVLENEADCEQERRSTEQHRRTAAETLQSASEALSEATVERDALKADPFATDEREAQLSALNRVIDEAPGSVGALVVFDRATPGAPHSSAGAHVARARTLALLEEIVARPLSARVLFVTNDDTIVAWARALDRRSGWYTELRETGARPKARWWSGFVRA